MAGFLYEQLNGDRFQELCQGLLTAVYPGIRCFPTGKADGGRDAGLAREGIVFQVKWTGHPERVSDPVKWLTSAVAAELPKIARLHDLGTRSYILMTNVQGSANIETGQIDRLDTDLARMLQSLQDLEIDVWWRETLDRHLEPLTALQWTYPEILTGRDVLAHLAQGAAHGPTEAQLRVPTVKVAEATARIMGVHDVIRGRGRGEDQPAYVPRDADPEVDSALTADGGSFVLLVGGPCTGKTRCAYEAIRRGFSDWELVLPENAAHVRTLLTLQARPMVIWLDEMQRFLGGTDGLTSATITSLWRWGAPVVFVGTIWPGQFQGYTHRPEEGAEDPYWRERGALRLARVVHMAPEFSKAERSRAAAMVSDDARLRESLDSRYGFTQTLAGAPQLVRRWQDSKFDNPYAHAMITAAVDARRMGIQAPLGVELLRHATPAYLPARQRATAPADWLEQAISYASEPLLGAVSVFDPVDAGMGVTAGYTVADYLVDYGSRIRRAEIPPPDAWLAYRLHVDRGRDLLEAGRSARARGLLLDAESLFRKAATTAEGTDAYDDLSQMLLNRGATELASEALTRWAEIATGDSRVRAASSLHLAGRDDDAADLLRAAIADGDTDAYMELGELLRWTHPRQALEAYRGALSAGDEEARMQIALILEELGDEEEAAEVLSSYPKGSSFENEQVRAKIAILLRDRGQQDESLRVAQELAEEEDSFLGYQLLGEMLTAQGRADEAIQMLRSAVERGHHNALDALARALVDADRMDEAEEAYRAAAVHGVGVLATDPLESLAYFLVDDFRSDEAISMLQRVIAAGAKDARWILGDILEDECRDAEAEQVWREVIADGDSYAWLRLGLLILDFDHNNDSQLEVELINMDRADDAIQVWKQGIDEGSRGTVDALRLYLSRLFELCGRLSEAEQIWREALAEGDSSAMERLADVLDLQGRHDESKSMYEAAGIHFHYRFDPETQEFKAQPIETASPKEENAD